MVSLVTARMATLAVTASILLPDPAPDPQRIPGLDIDRVRWAECEYRGITATFETLSKAYALKAYKSAEFIGWDARPSPRNPETEALVSCRFQVQGVVADSTFADSTLELRRAVGSNLEITWRLNTLYRIRISEHDDYARDALFMFTRTVDELHDRIAVVGAATTLRSGPGQGHETVASLEVGTIVLQGEQADGWSSIEVHGDTLAGWLETERLTIP
jgi:hypothetical protein